MISTDQLSKKTLKRLYEEKEYYKWVSFPYFKRNIWDRCSRDFIDVSFFSIDIFTTNYLKWPGKRKKKKAEYMIISFISNSIDIYSYINATQEDA